MKIILLLFLISYTVICYSITNNIFTPAVIVGGTFAVSSTFFIVNREWNYNLSVYSVVVIVLALLFFAAFSMATVSKGKIIIFRYRKPKQQRELFYIKKIPLIIISATTVFFCFRYIRYQIQLATNLGSSNNISSIISMLRQKGRIFTEEHSLGLFMNIGLSFCKAAGFSLAFLIIQNYVYKIKNSIFLYIPVVCLLINMFISGERGNLITLFSAIVFDYYIISKNNKSYFSNTRFIETIVLAFFCFIIIFWGMATLNGSSLVLNVWDTFSIYFGSSILCFDYLLQNSKPTMIGFGTYTFKGIYSLLKTFGFNVNVVSNNMEMVRWESYSSNIYTSLSTYYRDFGVIGILLFEVILGLIFGISWKRYNQKDSKFLRVNYGRLFGYAEIMFPIAERFFSQYFALNVIVELLFSILIVQLFLIHDIENNDIK